MVGAEPEEAMQALVNGIRMHWRETGRGDAVLFVHAFPLHGGMWDDQIDRLPQRWRWLAPDLRGFGGSEAGEGDGPLAMDLLADDLAAFLDAVGIDRAVLCGLSMGGYVALAFWRWHSDRVRALVLSDTRAGPDTEQGRAWRRELAERVRREGAVAVADAMLPKLLAERTRRERPEIVDRVRSMIESTPPGTLVRALQGLADRPDSTDLLPTIDVPTLVLVGEEDATTPVSEAEFLQRTIPDARLVVLPGAGHLPNLEAPEAFNRALVHFLEAIQGR
jgi:pimeloyl-ACP methyl ester carboxylesterase